VERILNGDAMNKIEKYLLGIISIITILLAILGFIFLHPPVQITQSSSTVGTSTVAYATQYPFQSKGFYARSRFWPFWSDGTNMVYSSSTDASSWSSATSVRPCTRGYKFSIWYDPSSNYVYYAYASTSSIYYCRGVPYSNGTIVWEAEQTISTTYNQANYPTISLSSTGYVWIGYTDYSGTTYYGCSIRSQYNNGTFGSGTIDTLISGPYSVSIIPLTRGNVLAIYATSGSPVKAKPFTCGPGWGTEVSTTSSIILGYAYSATPQGDTVHLAFTKNSGYDILYANYSYSTNSFGSEITLQSGASSTSFPTISIDSYNNTYVFWAGYPTSNHIYYRKYNVNTGTWESSVDWISEVALTGNDKLTCFYKEYSSNIGLEYMNATASPFQIRFNYLPIQAPGIVSGTPSYNETKAGFSVQFSCNWSTTGGLTLSGWIFSYDNYTGTGWTNSSWYQFPSGLTSGTALYNMSLPVLPNHLFSFRFYANATTNIWNVSSIVNLDITNAITYSNLSHNTTLSNNIVQFSVYFSSDFDLDWCGFQWYYYDAWTNVETVFNDLGTTSSWANITKMLPNDKGVRVYYRFIVNNTQGETREVSNKFTTTWPSDRYPTYNYVAINTSKPNDICTFSSNWASPFGLSSYIFSWNPGTGWINDTEQSIPSSPTVSWVNISKTLPNANRVTITWTVYVKDTNGKVERINPQKFVTTNSSVFGSADGSLGFAMTRLPSQLKTYYVLNLHWVFADFSDEGIGFGYKTSPDGITWSTATSLGGYSSTAAYWDLALDGTTVHIAHASFNYLFYRMGTLNSNGTITLQPWQTIETTAASTTAFHDPFIVLDSSGYPYVTALWDNLIDEGAYQEEYSKLYASTTKDGTWTMRSGFPQTLMMYSSKEGDDPDVWSIPISLSNGDMRFVIGASMASSRTYYMFSRKWINSTSSLSPLEQISKEKIYRDNYIPFSAIGLGGENFAFTYTSESGKIKYRDYINGTWSDEIELWSEAYGIQSSDISIGLLEYDSDNNWVFVFSAYVHDDYTVRYMKKDLNSGSWTSDMVLFSEPKWGLALACGLTGSQRTFSSLFSVMYTTNPDGDPTSGPWEGRYFFFNATTLVVPPSYSNVGTNSTSSQTNIQFQTKWQSDLGLSTAYFYWNFSGTLELNGTLSLNQQVIAWSNFTRYIEVSSKTTIEWKIVCEDIYGNAAGTEVQYLYINTQLYVGWNVIHPWNEDVNQTLGNVNASLNLDLINWTVIVLQYTNGTRYAFVYGYSYNAEIQVTSINDTFYIYCSEEGKWNHSYP